MTNIQHDSQLHNDVNSPPGQSERRGKEATMIRRAWAVVALLAAGWFLHDAIWHAMLVVFGMNAFLGTEFSLPDLSVYHIYPDRMTQTFAFLFAIVAASLLLWLGLRLRNHS